MCARLPVWKEVLPHPALCAAHQRVPHTPHGWPQEAAVGNCTENLGKIQADNIHHLTHINRGCLGNLQIQLCNYVCRQISPLRHKHGVLPTKNNQNLNFGCIIQAAIPKHFQVDCSKKIIIFGEAGSEGQLIKALASLQRSLKIQLICTLEVPTGGSIWGLGFPPFAVGKCLLFHTAGTEIGLIIPMKTCSWWHWSLFCSSWLFISVL